MTSEQVIQTALEYNRDDLEPEHDESTILNGRAEIQVTVFPDRRGGDRLRCIITPIVAVAGGGHYEAEPPTVKWIRWFDGRRAPSEEARRASRYLGLSGSEIPVVFKDGHR